MKIVGIYGIYGIHGIYVQCCELWGIAIKITFGEGLDIDKASTKHWG